MSPQPPALLGMPSYLFGTSTSAQQRALEEGRQYAEHFLKEGALPTALELQAVQPGAPVIVQESVDFLEAQPAWRLYRVRDTLRALRETLNHLHPFHVNRVYESAYRDTPWGALYYATALVAPYDAQCYSLRLHAVLGCWEALESARYIFRTPNAALTLEELLRDACGWATTAWCLETQGPFRTRLRSAADGMARATREDCIEAILRQVPHALPLARGLKHPHRLADLNLWRERLVKFDTEAFARVSAALTMGLLECAYSWDRQFGVQ